MLSFMREQAVSDLTGQEQSAAGAGQNPRDEEYLTVSAGGRNVRKTTSMLVALFVIGLISLGFMIKKSAPQTAAAADADTESRIEAAIARLTGIKAEMFNRMDEIVEKFYEFSDVQQVHVNQLAKNPFQHELHWTNLKKGPEVDDDMLRQQRLRKQAQMLRLLSIMRSEQGDCCMIDDKILREGDYIKGFRVSQIGQNFVKLELERNQTENLQIVLKLDE
jgi:preprotein translocase subunit SecG